MDWDSEVEYYKKTPYEYKKVDCLFIETLESCIVSCLADWSFIDAFATSYFRKEEIDFDRFKLFGRWKRVSRTNLRVWTLVKHGYKLFNGHFGKEIFKFKSTEIKQTEVRELVNEAVEKVVEFA